MKPEAWHEQIDRLFADAVELPADQRQAFLTAACDGDADVLAEVQKLIAAHARAEQSTDFLASPADGRRTAGAEPETRAAGDSDTGSSHLEVRCPSCRAPMEVALDTVLTDLTCSACGSHFSLVDQSQATQMAPSLTKLGRFELIERLGVGGFGTVWKARDKELDRTVAIKVPRQGAMTAEETDKFFREARAAAQLRHPNIVSVHEVGRDGDSIFIVSDFVRGVTLGDWLTGQKLTSSEAADLCARITVALHHAHEKGVVHRDLKPANIMIDGDGQPHLMDFGLARREAGEVTVTMDGQVLGTPAYMSPEQAKGEAHTADRRSDVYSLGVILFQLLTGELPFRGNARMLVHQVIHDEAPSPRKLNSSIPRDLETITLKCLEKDPSQRYQSALELGAELRRFNQGEPILARPIGAAGRVWRWCKRNRLTAALWTGFLTALVAGTTVSALLALRADRNARLYQHQRDEARTNFQNAALVLDSWFDERDPEVYEAKIKIRSQLVAEFPKVVQHRFNLAKDYSRLGDLLQAQTPDRARRQFEEAAKLFRQIINVDPQVLHWIHLAHIRHKLGEIASRDGDQIETRNQYEQAASDFAKIAEFPNLPELGVPTPVDFDGLPHNPDRNWLRGRSALLRVELGHMMHRDDDLDGARRQRELAAQMMGKVGVQFREQSSLGRTLVEQLAELDKLLKLKEQVATNPIQSQPEAKDAARKPPTVTTKPSAINAGTESPPKATADLASINADHPILGRLTHLHPKGVVSLTATRTSDGKLHVQFDTHYYSKTPVNVKTAIADERVNLWFTLAQEDDASGASENTVHYTMFKKSYKAIEGKPSWMARVFESWSEPFDTELFRSDP